MQPAVLYRLAGLFIGVCAFAVIGMMLRFGAMLYCGLSLQTYVDCDLEFSVCVDMVLLSLPCQIIALTPT